MVGEDELPLAGSEGVHYHFSERLRNHAQPRAQGALLEAEKEAVQKENRERTALNPQNYEFTLIGFEWFRSQPCRYVFKSHAQGQE